MMKLDHTMMNTMMSFLPPPPLCQGGVGLPRHDAACVGRVDGPLRARADRPRGSGALRSVRRAPCGVGRLRLHGEGVGPRDGGVSAHAAGTHQQSVLTTGTHTHTQTVCLTVFLKNSMK